MSIQNCPGFVYTVKKGDTMFRLASRYGITLDRLIAANPQVSDPNRLTIGQQLCIPTEPNGIFPTPPCPNGTIYTVRQGDTLFLIAQRNNITLDALIAANPQITDPNVIFPGQKICIPVAPVPPECEGGIIHVIQQGDTLFSLARFYGTTVEAIIAANPGIDPENLQIGQRICIPLPMPPQCIGELYTVQSGDTLSSIAQKFGITLTALIAANPQITDPDRIFPGQIICIPSEPPLECIGGTIHVIRAGDTLFNLARFYGTTVEAIIAANPGIDPNNLQIGQAICIPLPRPVTCDGELYTVRPGDTFFTIAREYGITVEMLVAANPQVVDPSRIFPGQILCIPEEGMPAIEECTFMMDRQPAAPINSSAKVYMNFVKGYAKVTAMGLSARPTGRCYLAWFITPMRPIRVMMRRVQSGKYVAEVGPGANVAEVSKVLITSEPPGVTMPGTPVLFSAIVSEKCY